jgi:hypothetical protein
VEELIGEATYSDKGLMPAKLYKQTPHYVPAFNATYKILFHKNIWLRDVIMVCTHSDSSPFFDVIGVFRTDLDFHAKVMSFTPGFRQYKYYKKDNILYVSFFNDEGQPNNAYIMSPYGIEKVGDSTFIDESFTEIMIGG